MGIWDVVRLLARRWPVSVPLLLLTGVAAMLTAHHVRPDHVATSYVSLLPPTVQYNPQPGQTRKVNPWDVDRLRDAVIVRLTTKSVAKQVRSEGFEGSWTVVRDERYESVIRIEVTSATEEDARATAGRLVRELDDEVAREQAGYPSLGPADKITTTRYDSGDEVEVVTAKIWRAVLVVVTGGLLVAAAASIGADAVVRRRRHRRRRPSHTSAPPAVTDAEATEPIRITHVPVQVPVVGGPPPGAARSGQIQPGLLGSGRSTTREQEAPSRATAPASDEATIVLPFSNAPWAHRHASAAAGDGGTDGATGATPRR